MAEKDILEKVLLSFADVFVDCQNAFMYGERRLEAVEMQPAPTESFYYGKGFCHGKSSSCSKERMCNQFADFSFFRMEKGTVKMQYFIENETEIRRRQVLRKASYQGGMYRVQLESEQAVYPVVGMVLDWTQKNTRIPSSLHDLLSREGTSEEDLEYVDDVKLKIHHMRNLSKKVRDRFVSDMGFVVDYLNEGTLEGRKTQKIVHVEVLCAMMEALTGDARFTEQVEELLEKQRKGEEIIMCEYIDMLEARGEARGIIKGEKVGEARGIIKGEQIGIAKGEKVGKEIGESRLATLLTKLYDLGRDEDARLAVKDQNARTQLYSEFSIA